MKPALKQTKRYHLTLISNPGDKEMNQNKDQKKKKRHGKKSVPIVFVLRKK